ncbi:MAG: hypothetical protein WC760_03000 [Bacteroidia bacterium]|jgi:hypothetical protein
MCIYHILRDFATPVVALAGFVLANRNIVHSANKSIDADWIKQVRLAIPEFHNSILEFQKNEKYDDSKISQALFKVTLLLDRGNKLHHEYINEMKSLVELIHGAKSGNPVKDKEGNIYNPESIDFKKYIGLRLGMLDFQITEIIKEKITKMNSFRIW